MARGQKTGGRDFQVGNPGPGRPKGSRDKVFRTFKASVRTIFLDVAENDPALLREAIILGIQATPPKSFPYLQLAAHYLDRKPVERLQIKGLGRLTDTDLEALEELLTRAVGENDGPSSGR